MNRRQLSLFAGAFAVAVTALALLYFVFLRPHYAALYDDVRDTDAAKIVAELDRQGIDYRLEEDGHRVMVPENDVSRARVLIAGSGVAMGDTVGFEIFDQSDMGLTEFAQKVNYQRALQGELARTIMMMDGIRFARVHLSLPDRSLFTANKPGPKAAVTVETQSHQAPDPDSVTGIQQLVASAVPDLVAPRVAVLDERGRLLNAATPGDDEQTNGLTEKQALEEYYRARVQGVAEKLLLGVAFRIRVLAVPTGLIADEAKSYPDAPKFEQAAAADTTPPSASPDRPTNTQPGDRDFALRIVFRSETSLTADDEQLLRQQITQATALQPDRGDTLRFESGPLDDPVLAGPATAQRRPAEPFPLAPIAKSPSFASVFGSRWFWLALVALAVLVTSLLRGRARLSADEQQSFADLLSENIAAHPEASDGH